MKTPQVNVVFGSGGLGRGATGSDFISGLMFTNNSLPSGFTTTDRIKKIFSLPEAVALGINDLYSDETQCVLSYSVSNKGVAGENVKWVYTDALGVKTTIADYSLITADVTNLTTSAQRAVSEINSGTNTHGFSAQNTAQLISVTVKKGEGIYPNNTQPIEVTATTFAGTFAHTVQGVASKRIVEYYQLSQYFRLNPKGVVYVGYYDTYDAENIKLMRDFANGEIRKFGVMHDFSTSFVSTQINALKAVTDNSHLVHKPITIIFAPEISTITNLSSLPNLAGVDAKNVSVTIGQDGSAFGLKLFKNTGKTISDLGAKLGAYSASKIGEAIDWVGKYNMSDGIELDVPAFGNGILFKNIADSLSETLLDYGYSFIYKLVDKTGTYNTQLVTCTANSSDQRFLELTEVLNKAYRGCRSYLLDELSAPIQLNADGTLSSYTVSHLESVSSKFLDELSRAGEINQYQVLIDPAQDISATNKVFITIRIIPIGKSSYIDVTIGFTKKI